MAPLRGSASRRGVTLVELLVAIMIMLLITAIAIPVIAPSIKNRDVREAARMIDVFINGARSRALQSGHSYGIMIERMPGQPNGAVTLSYCEQPDPYTGDFASGVSFPGMPPGASGSSIMLLGNGGFGAWGPPSVTGAPTVLPGAFPLGDSGWIAGPVPGGGTGWLTNIAPGDVVVVQGTQYRIWAGEPFLDLDQNGVCNVTAAMGAPGYVPGTPPNTQEPFLDVDGSVSWTPPNPAPGQPGNVPGQPYVDPASGYFVQPNTLVSSPFPVITWNTPSAFITYAPFDPVQSAKVIGNAYVNMVSNPGNKNIWDSLVSDAGGAGLPKSFPFSFQRRPVKTSAPSIQLPGEAVIDLGANYPDASFSVIVPIPGSGTEVLVANANAAGWWSTFRANPALDPTVPGSQAQQGTAPADPTSIMITFQPTGTVDRIYSWSEANNTNTTMSVVNWSDWQGRIPAGPIYLLVGQQALINGDPDLVPLVPQGVAPLKPIYNVQDPNALWVAINPQTGAVATAENVGFDLTVPIPTSEAVSGANAMQMQIYWAANVYYSRRLARAMLDMGGR
ncbi:MAG TPA: prepilin-type N-terminal cleavage/methylation domain-containing protein [Pirellulales bacterium]|nr:prepilin-type N-terminal cleavage/methylation domain-containing protein [Pirellulales bacterium]